MDGITVTVKAREGTNQHVSTHFIPAALCELIEQPSTIKREVLDAAFLALSAAMRDAGYPLPKIEI